MYPSIHPSILYVIYPFSYIRIYLHIHLFCVCLSSIYLPPIYLSVYLSMWLCLCSIVFCLNWKYQRACRNGQHLFRGFGSRWKGPQTGSTAQICALVSLPKNTWECDGTYPHFGMSCRKWLYKSWLYVRRLESQGGPAYGYLSTAIVSCCAS